jgi:hypothetical protein
MYWVGLLLAYLATIVVEWGLPLIGVALAMPLLQIVYTLQPLVAAGLMMIVGVLLVYYSIRLHAWWQAVVWGALWGMGVLAAGLGVFHWYSLLIEAILLIVLLIPGIVAPRWIQLLRWFAVGELGLSLLLIWGQGAKVPGVILVLSLLLLVLAGLVGSGTYRPFEARRLRRRLATLAVLAAIALILWKPVLQPTGNWLGQATGSLVQTVAASPIGRWYHVLTLKSERLELAEEAKTNGLRQLQESLTDAHRARWEKAINEIPDLPLNPDELEDLGIPQQADP